MVSFIRVVLMVSPHSSMLGGLSLTLYEGMSLYFQLWIAVPGRQLSQYWQDFGIVISMVHHRFFYYVNIHPASPAQKEI